MAILKKRARRGRTFLGGGGGAPGGGLKRATGGFISGGLSHGSQMRTIMGLPGVTINQPGGTFSYTDTVGGGPSYIGPGGMSTMDMTNPGMRITRPLPTQPQPRNKSGGMFGAGGNPVLDSLG